MENRIAIVIFVFLMVPSLVQAAEYKYSCTFNPEFSDPKSMGTKVTIDIDDGILSNKISYSYPTDAPEGKSYNLSDGAEGQAAAIGITCIPNQPQKYFYDFFKPPEPESLCIEKSLRSGTGGMIQIRSKDDDASAGKLTSRVYDCTLMKN